MNQMLHQDFIKYIFALNVFADKITQYVDVCLFKSFNLHRSFPGRIFFPALSNLIQFEEARSFNGWELGDIRTEYSRFRLPSTNRWRISYVNSEYKVIKWRA